MAHRLSFTPCPLGVRKRPGNRVPYTANAFPSKWVHAPTGFRKWPFNSASPSSEDTRPTLPTSLGHFISATIDDMPWRPEAVSRYGSMRLRHSSTGFWRCLDKYANTVKCPTLSNCPASLWGHNHFGPRWAQGLATSTASSRGQAPKGLCGRLP